MVMASMILFATVTVTAFLMEESVMVQDMESVVELLTGREEVAQEMVGREEGMAVDSGRDGEEDKRGKNSLN